jgi:hypothetical protein
VNAYRRPHADNSGRTKVPPAKWRSSEQHIAVILKEQDALIAENNKLRKTIQELEHTLAIERSTRRIAQGQCEILNLDKNENDRFIRYLAQNELERKERELREQWRAATQITGSTSSSQV